MTDKKATKPSKPSKVSLYITEDDINSDWAAKSASLICKAEDARIIKVIMNRFSNKGR